MELTLTQKSSAGEILPPWAIEHFLPTAEGCRYKIAYGGRGSGKSWAFARMVLIRSVTRKIRVLCARELQNSIADSCHALITDQIASLGLENKFLVKDKEIIGVNGSEIMFKGLRGLRGDASGIKSLEGIDICWIEEAQMISAASMETLVPTIRKPKSEIWMTFNPQQESDPVYKLILSPPKNAVIKKVNYDSNPWFHETTLPEEMEWLRENDDDAYRHVWLGECREISDAQVLRGKYRIAEFEPDDDWDGPYQGADWGFSKDPTVLVRCWVHEKTLFIEREAYGVQCDIDVTPELFDAPFHDYDIDPRLIITRADNARPETISFMKRHGYGNIVSVDKWKGSVEDGVAFLRAFDEIVIHPECPRTAEEAALWSYKVDRLSGDVLPKLVDKYNHCFDAVRYALAPLIKRREFQYEAIRIPGL